MDRRFINPDIKGTRYRKTCHYPSIDQTLTKFKAQYPKYRYVSISEFNSIINKFSLYMREQCIENRDGIELPEGLGFVSIRSYKSKKKLVDYGKSILLGQRVYHTNLDTDSLRAKIYYTNATMKYKLANKQLWAFDAVREFTRQTSAAFSKNYKNYIEGTISNRKVFNSFGKVKAEPLFNPEDTYNEFDDI